MKLVSTVKVIVLVATITAFLLLAYHHHHGNSIVDYSTGTSFKSIRSQSRRMAPLSQIPTLPQEVIDNIKTFFIFLGYPRSGHTILRALLDAHPNIVASHQLGQCEDKLLRDKKKFFNKMYQNSYRNAVEDDGARSQFHTKKNYTMYVPNSWQGKYDEYIQVIGDKQTCRITNEKLKIIHKYLQTDVKSIIPVRNPFDLITTGVLYDDFKRLVDILQTELDIHLSKEDQNVAPIVVARYKQAMKELLSKGDESKFQSAMYDNPQSVETIIRETVARTRNHMKRASTVGWENVLIVHNNDLVSDPASLVNRMCTFFKVPCPPSYVQSFVDKVFKSVSKTRSLIVWPPHLKDMVETQMITKFEMFNRYSFESD